MLLVIIGVLFTLAGVVFTLQGEGIVGPQRSFMYNNPTWIYQGVVAAFVGILIIIGGFVLGRRRAGVGPS